MPEETVPVPAKAGSVSYGRGLQATTGAWIRKRLGLILTEEIHYLAIQGVRGSTEVICRFKSA